MKTIIEQIHDLAKQAYKNEEISPLSLYKELYKRFPETFLIEMDGNKVLGYIILCYLNIDNFNLTLEPDFQESKINFNEQKEPTNQVYFFSIVVDQKVKNPYIATKLINKFKKFLIKFDVSAYSALIYSKEGERLSTFFKMTQIAPRQYVMFLSKDK